MKPAAEQLRTYLQQVAVRAGDLPVIHNADVASHNTADAIKDALVRQLYSPVRWVETVQAVHAMGVTQTAECGPGKVLAGLTKRIVAELPCIALIGQESLAEAKSQFNS